MPNPARRFPLACGPEPERLGLRVPGSTGPLAPLAAVRWPVLQSSANRSGGADARRRRRGRRAIRAGVDLILDGGELPGHALDRGRSPAYEDDGTFAIVPRGGGLRGRVGEILGDV